MLGQSFMTYSALGTVRIPFSRIEMKLRQTFDWDVPKKSLDEGWA